MAAKNKEITLESLHNLIVTRFDSLEKRITSLEDRMTSLEYRVSSLEIEMTRMKESLDFVRETTVAMNKKFEGEFEKIYLYTNSKTGVLERDLTSHEYDLA